MVRTYSDDAAVCVPRDTKQLSLQVNPPSAVQNKQHEETASVSEDSSAAEYVLDTFEVARFWSRVEVRKKMQCWPWRYGCDDAGYGEFRLTTGPRDFAHRIAYRLQHGIIPNGSVIRHACDNPHCCNPDHLAAGTHADNVADRVNRNRSAVGETNGRSKLTADEVRHIRDSRLSGKYLAGVYDVSEDTIDDVRNRVTWRHLP